MLRPSCSRAVTLAVLCVVGLTLAACTESTGPQREESITVPRPDPTEPPTTEAPKEPVPTTVPLPPTDQWKIDRLEAGMELPGGGFDLFPSRRLVALYGSPITTQLGVLGEYQPAGAIEELARLTAEYETAVVEGEPVIPVLPSFEVIVTVASSQAGSDGNYSNEMAIEDVRPWIEAATEAGIYVILDLQPGRTDFLTQAKIYEEFIRLPNVGLALDPEWRIGPDEVHLVKVGTVTAAEVNTVVDWLTEIVREEALPQKMLVLHQFRISMLPDRELVRTPPELAVLVHADGQGPLNTKYSTYDQLLAHPSPPEQTLWWGWKNFYDEDFPMATAPEVNALTPLPVVVTFQ